MDSDKADSLDFSAADINPNYFHEAEKDIKGESIAEKQGQHFKMAGRIAKRADAELKELQKIVIADLKVNAI